MIGVRLHLTEDLLHEAVEVRTSSVELLGVRVLRGSATKWGRCGSRRRRRSLRMSCRFLINRFREWRRVRGSYSRGSGNQGTGLFSLSLKQLSLKSVVSSLESLSLVLYL
jgi:hypothetical protein